MFATETYFFFNLSMYVCLFNLSSLYLTVKLERPLINFNTLFLPKGAHIGMLCLHVLHLNIFVSTVIISYFHTGFLFQTILTALVLVLLFQRLRQFYKFFQVLIMEFISGC